ASTETAAIWLTHGRLSRSAAALAARRALEKNLPTRPVRIGAPWSCKSEDCLAGRDRIPGARAARRVHAGGAEAHRRGGSGRGAADRRACDGSGRRVRAALPVLSRS